MNNNHIYVTLVLTLKQLETRGCVINTVATDALVLKHQVIGIQSVDKIFIVLEWFQMKNI